MNKISIVVPAYNASQYIVECLNSIVKQNLEEYEIIIVNDGSKDNTQETCERYISQNAGVNIKIINQPNGGVSVARNQGVEAATGEWVMFVDADDMLLHPIFTHLDEADTENADIIMLEYTRSKNILQAKNCQTKFIDSELFIKCALRYPKYCREIQKSYNIDPYSNWSCWGKLFKRAWLVENGIKFPEGVFTSEDCVFLLRAYSTNPKILVTDIVMYYYRVNGQSVTHTFNPRILDNYKKIFDCLKCDIGNDSLREDLDVYISERIIECVRYYANNKGRPDNEQLTNMAKVFSHNAHLQCIYRCPISKVFTGKKNRVIGTYWLLKLKILCRKMENENTTRQ